MTITDADASEQVVYAILQDIHDLDPDDPNDPETVCINDGALTLILRRHILGEE